MKKYATFLLAFLLSSSLHCQILQTKFLFPGCQDPVAQKEIIGKLKSFVGARKVMPLLDLKDFQVLVSWEKSAQIQTNQLFSVFSTGFVLSEIEVMISGSLEQGGNDLFLRSMPENTLFTFKESNIALLKKETKNFRWRNATIQAKIVKSNVNNQLDILNYKISS